MFEVSIDLFEPDVDVSVKIYEADVIKYGLIIEQICLNELINRIIDIVVGLARVHDQMIDRVGIEQLGSKRVGKPGFEQLAA